MGAGTEISSALFIFAWEFVLRKGTAQPPHPVCLASISQEEGAGQA